MTPAQHLRRLVGLIVFAAGLLGWLAFHTDTLFADGLRYIRHAQTIRAGDLARGLFRSIDHPIYPLAIAAVRKVLGGSAPLDWQHAAQGASILSALLLVIPLYLIAKEIVAPRFAWLGVALAYIVPVTSHVFADALSESTFLLFWCWGLWGAIRFLKEGSFGWLFPAIAGAVLAYLTRPEGLLLPAALVASLALMPLLKSTRLNWPRWWAAVGVLVIAPAIVVGPYAWTRGGLGSKPAIARILGTMPKAPPDAVERGRVLDENQGLAKTYATAAKETFEAIRDAVTIPLLVLAAVGLALGWKDAEPVPRVRLFLGIIAGATLFALIRLHATSGYCTPRHTLSIALLIFPLAGAGFLRLMDMLVLPGRWFGLGEERLRPGPAVWVGLLGGFVLWVGATTFTPLNPVFKGYRGAGRFLADSVPADAKVVDFAGFALFYGDHPGYTFRQIAELEQERHQVRWVVARDSHLKGPWSYSKLLRDLTDGLEPVQMFPEEAEPGVSRILIFDRAPILAAEAADGTLTR